MKSGMYIKGVSKAMRKGIRMGMDPWTINHQRRVMGLNLVRIFPNIKLIPNDAIET